MKEILNRKGAPPPLGPYSPAVGFGNLIFISGQVPIDSEGNLIEGGIREQTNKVLTNIKLLLEDNGSSLEKVIKTTVFLKNMSDFTGMNEEYAKYFTVNPPARSTVEVSRLPKDGLLELDVIAYK
jgi:2-iminobutanoate/2-iminopropanoate deaminase